MPLNLLKEYNNLLDLIGMDTPSKYRSLRGVFDRDFIHSSQPTFIGKPVFPTPKEGLDIVDILFAHLTTVIVDKKERRREFDLQRSLRLHWVRFHLDQRKTEDILVFSVKEPEGIRTYIYDRPEKYVVILEPLKKTTGYYLLTAYYVEGRDAKRNKFEKKYKRRLQDVL
ncbi:hypothetical protein [Algoriphagus zhangzhouensis]|uniref:Phage-Barnase-EndoU-ColicinE5/D-RelE like nuclease 2 domain-containing protein n=1 Tax=Algoriphagus zhangzhouensis TaxID=1073327 RepID=A0A1M7ZDR3_9BACT|nr:hypothetical protein [Algoriphagus zhangzhouensis]TDY45875.1 hypothetical protein A8938_2480 [Algoriphagus zhangzhouensis]SHO63030.1 hypothetical protein SAMN04488108_2477 [Algoriphagus zhangzhouensis]